MILLYTIYKKEKWMSKNDIFLTNCIWGVNGATVFYAKFFADNLLPNSKVLFIGTGFDDCQYLDWPALLEKIEPTIQVSYLEIFKPYIDKFKDGKYPIIHGDVTKIDEVIANGTFDIICWFHGPEHVDQNKLLSTFDKLYNSANKAIIAAAPWGKYYDYQEELHTNPYEKHLIKNMGYQTFDNTFSNYSINYFNVKDTGDGSIIITRIKQ